jgi:hypothetical protein
MPAIVAGSRTLIGCRTSSSYSNAPPDTCCDDIERAMAPWIVSACLGSAPIKSTNTKVGTPDVADSRAGSVIVKCALPLMLRGLLV